MSNARPSDAALPSARLVLQVEGSRRTTITLQISSERTLVGRSDEDSSAALGLDLGLSAVNPAVFHAVMPPSPMPTNPSS